jgi:hypothetical protein
METSSRSPKVSSAWSEEAFVLVAQAKVLSGNKLEQLVTRLQRHSGRSREACWRFVIQYGIKGKVEHRRWTEEEIETVREDLVRRSIQEVARKLKRSPKAVRNMLQRNALRVREIRCDLFSVEGLANALRVRRSEVLYWIKQNWLQATIEEHGKRKNYAITPEALGSLYKQHLQDLLKRGIPNQSLFEAYLLYCYSPKHTVGSQLLDVRRDKKERAAYAAARETDDPDEEEGEGEDQDEDDTDEERYHFDIQTGDESAND